MPKEKFLYTEDSKRFTEAVEELIKKGVSKREISYAIDLNEGSLGNILRGIRNIPKKAANLFEAKYGVKIITAAGSLHGLSETAIKTLAVANANRKALAAIYGAVLKMPPEKAAEILESLYREELQTLKDELIGD